MSRRIVDLCDEKTALSQLIDRAAAGEEITIATAGKPRARLVLGRSTRAPRKPGGWEGRVRIGKDFNAPPPKALRDAFEDRP